MIVLDQFRDTWLKEKMEEVIGFYPREFYCFDNFSSFKIEYEGYLYSTVEEAYQSLGFKETAPDIYNQIIHSHSAHEAQKLAYANREKRRKDWDTYKITLMEKLLRCKIEQNPYVKKKLLQTKDYMIVEDSPKDDFWGWGPNRDGVNQLGKLWMKLRDEIRNNEK